MRRECRQRFSRRRALTISKYITARAWRTCRDTCWDRQLAVFFEVSSGGTVIGIRGVCASRNFTYPVRGTWLLMRQLLTWSGHHRLQWYWLCRIKGFLFFTKRFQPPVPSQCCEIIYNILYSMSPVIYSTAYRLRIGIDVYFDLRPNKRLSKQSWGWWFEMPSRPLWRHRNAI